MRDPDRIRENWQKIAELHEKIPEWRMGQFLVNIIKEQNFDPFYLEDDIFLKTIEIAVEKLLQKIQSK